MMGLKHDAKPPPGIYRDDPDRDDAASTSSAVLLDEVQHPVDSELPAYEDVPTATRPALSHEEEPLSSVSIHTNHIDIVTDISNQAT